MIVEIVGGWKRLYRETEGAMFWVRTLRSGSRFLQGRNLGKPSVRRAGGGPHIEPQYRQYPQLTKKQVLEAEFLSGFMWFWIFWHLWHDPDAVLGHFTYPDPSKWTDEELGIPPIDEE
ncbi:NADH dehydrogenase [ubiquinone] 1 beta subcomplex subunit 2, mitochondrial [Stegostoma tigrinum]|uniref:NADH dehydrogenase [ubiquinone] 1 beta subcomplex subunit 2, mitochondrial n=1 Tax=Stegostoma tigrinum TaxID=3053191 RepID=UPI00202ADA62|nr:NADH dehydrogenase [ubiquinone] 1 beta subcomplex subunit 2, mitochondrial [Stegostoma tigrinum]